MACRCPWFSLANWNPSCPSRALLDLIQLHWLWVSVNLVSCCLRGRARAWIPLYLSWKLRRQEPLCHFGIGFDSERPCSFWMFLGSVRASLYQPLILPLQVPAHHFAVPPEQASPSLPCMLQVPDPCYHYMASVALAPFHSLQAPAALAPRYLRSIASWILHHSCEAPATWAPALHHFPPASAPPHLHAALRIQTPPCQCPGARTPVRCCRPVRPATWIWPHWYWV